MSILIVKLSNYVMPKLTLKLCILSLAFSVGCSSKTVVIDTGTLSGLQAMGSSQVSKNSKKKQKLTRIKAMALQEIALSLGAQAGLAYRANLINKDLTAQARRLDTIFNFNALVLEHNILPPVLLEGRNILNLADDQSIRISDRTYRISRQARFITTPPTWREYLWMDYKKPEFPNQTLLPKNKVEREVWCTYVAKGWNNGVEQANTILEESTARIKEDYSGMILYRKLLAMNMVSPPFVSHTNLGITGDESEIHIDDRVLRITALPALNINSSEWRAAVTKEENVLEQFKTMEKLARGTKITITSKAWQPIIAPVNDEK